MKTLFTSGFAVLAFFGLLPNLSFAQFINGLTFTKTVEFDQTNASTTTATGASFGVGMSGFSLSTPILTVPSGTEAGSISLETSGVNFWGFQDSSFANIAAVNSAYGAGFYSISYDGEVFDLLGYPAGVFLPDTPLANISGGFWSGGEYFFDVANELTISSNLFATNYSLFGSGVQIEIRSLSGGNVSYLPIRSNQLLPFSPLASSFVAGQSYDVDLTFYTLVNPATTGPGSFANFNDVGRPHTSFQASYAADTHFVLHAYSTPVPEPSIYWAASTATLGFMAWLRSRRRNRLG